MIHAIIITLLIGILIALAAGFYFFYKDQGRSRRVMYALGVRVTLAMVLLIIVLYGLGTGQLEINAPWM